MRVQAKTLGFSNMLDAVAYDVVAEDTKPDPAVPIEVRGGMAGRAAIGDVVETPVDRDAVEDGADVDTLDRLIAGMKILPPGLDVNGEAVAALEEARRDAESEEEAAEDGR